MRATRARALHRPWSRRRWLAALPLLTTPALLSTLAAPTSAEPTRPERAAVQWPPRLETVAGQWLDTAAWQGQPAVVVFWATWCGYCRRHNARIDQLYRALDGRRLTILGVAIDGSAASVGRHVAEHRYGFPVVLDTMGLRQRITERRMVPVTCLLDREGRVSQCIPGEMAEADVLELVRLALPAAR